MTVLSGVILDLLQIELALNIDEEPVNVVIPELRKLSRDGVDSASSEDSLGCSSGDLFRSRLIEVLRLFLQGLVNQLLTLCLCDGHVGRQLELGRRENLLLFSSQDALGLLPRSEKLDELKSSSSSETGNLVRPRSEKPDELKSSSSSTGNLVPR